MKKSLIIIGMLIAVVSFAPLSMAHNTTSTTTTIRNTTTTTIKTTTTTTINCTAGIRDPWYPKTGNKSELNLYQIFNEIFIDALGSTPFLSSSELNPFPDDVDDWWLTVNQGGVVKFTLRYAGFSQELGILPDGGTYQPLITNIAPGGPQNRSVTFTAPGRFAFVEKADKYTWYSADALNPIQDGVDHFMAFDVKALYELQFGQIVNQAWLIAFEDYPGGFDCDYQDLVAIVIEVQPTLINLSSFTAKASNAHVKLDWVTESEIDNIGFNIYRAESESGAFSKINAVLTPAKGSSTQGASYEFTDTNVQNRKTYYYKLEDMDLNGNSTMHGPVSATPRWILGIGK